MTEGAVFGGRAGRAAAQLAASSPSRVDREIFEPTINAITQCFGREGSKAAYSLKLELQNASWTSIGPVRTADNLKRFSLQTKQWLAQLSDVAIPSYAVWNQSFIEFVELRNMIEVAQAVAAAATERDCSVGGHVRLDGQDVPPFAQPFSTVVHRATADTTDREPVQVFRVRRQRTPPFRAMLFRVTAKWRQFQANGLRLLPASIQDNILEKRYRTLMGGSGSAPVVKPGGASAAIRESAIES